MFSDKECSGHHLIIDLKNCNNAVLLNSVDEGKILFEEICRVFNFTVLNRAEYKFEPHGYTILYMLSESHISIHTFPERNFASFDLYSCRHYDDTKELKDIYSFVLDNFGAENKDEPFIIKRTF
jgi:S-adenosylmethionine decarboxylase proenzyme